MKVKKILTAVLVAAISASLAALPVGAQGNSENSTPAESQVSAYFDGIKDNKSALIAFLQDMPKGGDLHTHVSAVVEIETVLKYAAEHDYDFDVKNKKFILSSPDNTGDDFIKSDVLKELYNSDSTTVPSKTRELIMTTIFDNLSMRNYTNMPENSHDLFFQYFSRTVSIDAATYYEEYFTRAVHQNISYLELMANINTAADYEGIIKIKDRVLKSLGKNPSDLTINFLATVNRNQGIENFKTALNAAVSRVDNPDLHTVGITVLSAEDDIASQQEFDAQMSAIDELVKLREKNNKKPINFHLHAGELTLDYATYESMTDRISESVYKGHAKTIGHGVSIAWNEDVYDLLKYMRDEKIGVAVCPTSNEAILGVPAAENQFGLYWEADVPVAIATDDEGLSRTNLTNEYAKIITAFDLDYTEVKFLAFSSLEMAYTDGDSLFAADNKDFSLTVSEFNELYKNRASLSDKAKLELDLYRRFYEFEKEMNGVINEFNW
jgi:adenosine deaminase